MSLERQRIEPGPFSVEGTHVGVYVPATPASAALLAPVLEAHPDVRFVDGLALVALIGRPLDEHGHLERPLELLEQNGIAPIEAFVGVGRASQTFVVPRGDVERALTVLHAALIAGAIERV